MKLIFKDIIRFISFKVVDFFIKSGEIRDKTLIIIKLDVIGDYILFRNFLEELKKSQKYKDYTITLVGNSSYEELALGLDAEFIDHFVFINFKKMTRNIWYRYKIFSAIARNGYEIVLNSTYSREFNVTDSLVHILNAKEKIGNVGVLGNIPKWQKRISDHYYTRLIQNDNDVKFEFLRNKDFFEALLGKKINIKKTSCALTEDLLNLPAKYIAIFPGASTQLRKWSIDNFAKVSEYIIKTYDCDVVILGGPADSNDAYEIGKKIQHLRVKNLAGQTSLLETVKIIKDARLLISNETSAPHMAVMVNTPVIVLYNGNNFNRFIPYPKTMVDNYYPVYHPEIEKNFKMYEKISNVPGYLSQLDMNDITIETVVSLIDQCQFFFR